MGEGAEAPAWMVWWVGTLPRRGAGPREGDSFGLDHLTKRYLCDMDLCSGLISGIFHCLKNTSFHTDGCRIHLRGD